MSESDEPKRLIARGEIPIGIDCVPRVQNVNKSDDPNFYDDPDECPAGGEHDWQEIYAATAREPVHTYCRKCRVEWKE